MAAFEITTTRPGRLEARGAMSYASAAQALRTGLDLIPHGGACTVDLSKVTEADSAGLAVLVEWLSAARARGTTVVYQNVPAQILAIARISGLEELLAPQPV